MSMGRGLMMRERDSFIWNSYGMLRGTGDVGISIGSLRRKANYFDIYIYID